MLLQLSYKSGNVCFIFCHLLPHFSAASACEFCVCFCFRFPRHFAFASALSSAFRFCLHFIYRVSVSLPLCLPSFRFLPFYAVHIGFCVALLLLLLLRLRRFASGRVFLPSAFCTRVSPFFLFFPFLS